MATRITSQPPNRSGSSGVYGGAGNSVDVGLSTVTRMAREDTRWFIAGVIILSFVLFFVLPMAVLVYVDMQKRLTMAEVRIERKLRKLEQLEESIKKEKDESSSNSVKRTDAGGM